jgi:amino acid permease
MPTAEMPPVLELVSLIFHLSLWIAMIYGTLFSNTFHEAFCVLSLLIVVFIGYRLLRLNKIPFEGDELTRLFMEFMLEETDSVKPHYFEEALIGFTLLLQIIRTYLIFLKAEFWPSS